MADHAFDSAVRFKTKEFLDSVFEPIIMLSTVTMYCTENRSVTKGRFVHLFNCSHTGPTKQVCYGFLDQTHES